MSWIKVEDKLPKTGDRVIVTDGFMSFEASYSHKDEWIRNNSYNLIDMGYKVIAWQPMPKWEVEK